MMAPIRITMLRHNLIIALFPAFFHSPSSKPQKLEERMIKIINRGQAIVGARAPPISADARLKNTSEHQQPNPINTVK